MCIIREKTHSKEFVILHKSVLNDPNLSLRTKGLWAYLMGLPDDWAISASEVANHTKDGVDCVRSGLKELVDNGYAEKIQSRKERGKFAYGGWKIFELKKRVPNRDFPYTVKPATANAALLSTDRLSTKETKKESLKEREDVVSPSALRLATFLFEKIKSRNPKMATPNLKEWALHIDSLLKKTKIRDDPYTPEQVHEVIEWAHHDWFWYRNILSGKALKCKMDRLIIEKNGQRMSKKAMQEDNTLKEIQMMKTNQQFAKKLMHEHLHCFSRDFYMQWIQGNDDTIVGIDIIQGKNYMPLGFLDARFKDRMESFMQKIPKKHEET